MQLIARIIKVSNILSNVNRGMYVYSRDAILLMGHLSFIFNFLCHTLVKIRTL
jgi:hypothetical protein